MRHTPLHWNAYRCKMYTYILTPTAAEQRLFEQYPGQTKLIYFVHLWHYDCLFNVGLRSCRCISYLIWLPWQQQTLNCYNIYYSQSYIEIRRIVSIHIILDVIALLSCYRILPAKRYTKYFSNPFYGTQDTFFVKTTLICGRKHWICGKFRISGLVTAILDAILNI